MFRTDARMKKALKCAEAYLLKRIGIAHKVALTTNLTDASTSAITEIERTAFRPELRYTSEELLKRAKEKSFLLLIVYASNDPVGFAMGYEDPQEPASFYLDTLATVERRVGIGKVLLWLTSICCFTQGFHHITIRTEERDERGSPKTFYEKMEFYTIPCEPSEGIAMKKGLDRQKIEEYIHNLCNSPYVT